MAETISNSEGNILYQIKDFVTKNKRFNNLPPNLKKIAVDTAVYALSLSYSDLLLVAGEIDTHGIFSPFARMEEEGCGSLLDNHQKLRLHLLETGRSYDVTQQVSLRQLRISIASRKSREELAEALRWRHGREKTIVERENFQTANDLAWQAVKELQN